MYVQTFYKTSIHIMYRLYVFFKCQIRLICSISKNLKLNILQNEQISGQNNLFIYSWWEGYEKGGG